MSNEESVGFAIAQVNNIKTGIARWFGEISNRNEIVIADARFVRRERRFRAAKQQRRKPSYAISYAWYENYFSGSGGHGEHTRT